MLNPLAPGFWDLDAPMTVFGIRLGHRMTVVRLAGGTLWVHSPVACSGEVRAALRDAFPFLGSA